MRPSVRHVLELRNRYDDKGGLNAVRIHLRLPNGQMYRETGKLDFVDIGVAKDTDTILLRGTIPNPTLPTDVPGVGRLQELANDEFVTVILEAVEPLSVPAVPRAAILADQQGPYIYVVNDKDVAERRRCRAGARGMSSAFLLRAWKLFLLREYVLLSKAERAQSCRLRESLVSSIDVFLHCFGTIALLSTPCPRERGCVGASARVLAHNRDPSQ
ncbi:MAG TPA: hypothetical protein VL966_12150 [Alphaproteobacteria bacterium]|jgi:hypothetical protein|nr:hypothetical protein [Alphaproteobacteria bacterium]